MPDPTWVGPLEGWQFAIALREAEMVKYSTISENELTTLSALAAMFGDIGVFEGTLATVVDAAVGRLLERWPD